MSENWTIQTSIKVEGQHLVNLRSEDGATQLDLLKWATENREAILAACAALEGSQKPQPARPASAPAPAPNVSQGGGERELGPIQLDGVEIKKGPREGPPWKSPMYVLKFEGSSCSTFDALNGKAAMGFWTQGSPCFLTVAPGKNPKYLNLVSIRSAVAA